MNTMTRKAVWVGSIVVAAIATLALIVVFFPGNVLRGPIATYASAQLGRAVAIDGDLSLKLGWTPRVQADGVSIGNAPWSTDQPMAQVRRMSLSVELLPLLSGERRVPEVELIEPNLLLEKNQAGEANWIFGGSPVGAVHVGTISVDKGVVRYRDPALRADVTLNVQTERATADTPSAIRFTGDGKFRDEPFRIEGQGLGLAQLRKIDDPYRLTLHAKAGSTDVRFDGSIVPNEPENVQGELKLQGQDMSQLYPIVPAPIPWTPPYKLSGALSHHRDKLWTFRQFKGTVGDSDLAGDVLVDLSRPRRSVTADLVSRRFDYKDLGGFVGLPPGEAGRRANSAEQQEAIARRAASTHALPDEPFKLDRLRAVDADVRFRGTSVKWSSVPIDNLVSHLVLKDGVLKFEPLDFGIADGHVVASLSLDANGPTARTQGQIEVRNVELKRIFPTLASPKGTAGRFGGRIRFKTQGNTVAAMAAAADGEGGVIMHGGEASTLALVLTNLDLARAAMLMLGGDKTSEIRCAVAAFDVAGGKMTPNPMVIDTSAVTITATGHIDFHDEKYDLHLKAQSKKPSLIALRGPIVIDGTFKTPAVHPEMGPVAARVGAAAGLAFVTPPLALLPLIDTGGASDVDCSALVAEAKLNSKATKMGG